MPSSLGTTPAHVPDADTPESYARRMEAFLSTLLPLAGLEVEARAEHSHRAESDLERPDFVVRLLGGDEDILLERHAELLSALEHLTFKVVRLPEEFFGKIVFDCKDWRYLREQELKLMAQAAAERARRTRSPFRLSPMNARERRIIHLALKDDATVRTSSEGFGPQRQVVIYPVDAESSTATSQGG